MITICHVCYNICGFSCLFLRHWNICNFFKFLIMGHGKNNEANVLKTSTLTTCRTLYPSTKIFVWPSQQTKNIYTTFCESCIDLLVLGKHFCKNIYFIFLWHFFSHYQWIFCENIKKYRGVFPIELLWNFSKSIFMRFSQYSIDMILTFFLFVVLFPFIEKETLFNNDVSSNVTMILNYCWKSLLCQSMKNCHGMTEKF